MGGNGEAETEGTPLVPIRLRGSRAYNQPDAANQPDCPIRTRGSNDA